MSIPYVPDESIIQQAAQADSVRAALLAEAQRILPIAQRIAYQEHATRFGDSLHVEAGIRPGTKAKQGLKRPYARVIADSEDAEAQEYGTAQRVKTMILARAASQAGD